MVNGVVDGVVDSGGPEQRISAPEACHYLLWCMVQADGT